jgi:hypothetical protein
VQQACDGYVRLLTEAGLRISMARRGNPYDNAQAESFLKTLKHEEVNLTEHRNLEQAASSIGAFIEQIYNRERVHSALGYLPPAELWQNLHPPVAGENTARQRDSLHTNRLAHIRTYARHPVRNAGRGYRSACRGLSPYAGCQPLRGRSGLQQNGTGRTAPRRSDYDRMLRTYRQACGGDE